MSYLESKGVLHRDLAARNILISMIDGHHQAKVQKLTPVCVRPDNSSENWCVGQDTVSLTFNYVVDSGRTIWSHVHVTQFSQFSVRERKASRCHRKLDEYSMRFQ